MKGSDVKIRWVGKGAQCRSEEAGQGRGKEGGKEEVGHPVGGWSHLAWSLP